MKFNTSGIVKVNHSVEEGWQKNNTSPVRQYEGKGNSPYGVVDMSGNVLEWCITGYNDGTQSIYSHTDKRVLRGGSWYGDTPNLFRTAYRSLNASDSWGSGIGFRCVRS